MRDNPGRNFFRRAGRIRQHEIGDGLSRGRLGGVRGRGWPLPGHDGGPRRERSTEAATALSPSELSPGAPSPATGRARPSPGDQLELDLDEHQLRDGEHGFRWNATWDGDYATHSGWRRSRMGPVSGTVSSAAARETLQAVGRRIGLLIMFHDFTIPLLREYFLRIAVCLLRWTRLIFNESNLFVSRVFFQFDDTRKFVKIYFIYAMYRASVVNI